MNQAEHGAIVGNMSQKSAQEGSGIEARFLTLQDVSAYLNVSVPQVYALVRSGDLPAIKLGGRGVWRVDRDKLEEYVKRLHEETQTWAKAHPLNPKT